MKTRAALLIVLFGLLVFAVDAQDEQMEYRLRTPTANEYLVAIPEIMEIGNTEVELPEYGTPFNGALFQAMVDEIFYRYSQLWHANTELLYEAYQTFLMGNSVWYERDIWSQVIISSWLNQHNIDLNVVGDLRFLEYQVTVTPRDFDMDGQTEWTLHVESEMFAQDIVVKHDTDGYRVLESPLPWFGCCFPHWDTRSGFTKEMLFDDMNADGLPEWVLAFGGIGANHTSFGELYILQWRDGKLVNLAPRYENWQERQIKAMEYIAAAGGGQPLFPHGVSVDFRDVNNDAKIEVIIDQEYTDNWECDVSDSRIFAWDAKVQEYRLSDHIREYADSAGCALRSAQAAMWERNYEAAIPLFERSMALSEEKSTEENVTQWEMEFVRAKEVYAKVRLALAYSFVGRNEDAAELLKRLEAPKDYPPINELVTAAQTAYAKSKNTYDLCLTMYEIFGNYIKNDPLGLSDWGTTTEYIVPMVSVTALPSYAHAAGCDINQFEEVPTPTPYPTFPAPTPDTRTQEQIWLEGGNLSDAFNKGYYELVLRITVAHKDAGGEADNMQMRYYRALALEALNRPDEALAEYVAIYEAAPESAWGRLAALHLERVEDEGNKTALQC